MEAVMLHHNRNLDRQFSSRPSDFYYPYYSSSPSFYGGGLMYAPPPSFPAPSLPINPRGHPPPLLPLPIPNPYQNTRPINNKIIKHRSLPVKKTASSGAGAGGPKRDRSKNYGSPVKVSSKSVNVSSNIRLGPDPKEVPRVLFSGNSSKDKVVTEFSGPAVSTVLSPPPSSLPLPSFSVRPKLSCNAEAVAGIDAGATDGLRRILRLP